MVSAENRIPTTPTQYVWWFPGSPVKVHLDLHVVQRLKDQLKSGAQQEGLLFGRTRDGATEILEIEPAPDSGVAEPLDALPKDKPYRALVGYYRTESGDLLRLNDRDRELAERYFPKPYQVLLVIQTTDFGPPTATFFFHDADRHMADFAFMEFPLDPSLLTIEERNRIRRSQQALSPASPPAERPLAALPAAVLPPARDRWVRYAALWILGLCLIGVAGFAARGPVTRFLRAVATGPNTPPAVPKQSAGLSLGLHARRQNTDLELTWSRDSALIAVAQSGVIAIQDGKSKREIPLNAAQVHGGSLLYSPSSDQITMQLMVMTPEITATETVMVVLPKGGVTPQTYELSASRLPANPAASGATEEVVQPAKPSRPFQPPQPATSARVTPLAAEPPPVAPPAFNPGAPPSLLARALPVPPTPAAPAQRVSGGYQPPVPISKVLPRYHSNGARWGGSSRVIEIKVYIDQAGNVDRTELTSGSWATRDLLEEAQRAARLWKFQPGRLSNQPIASEFHVQFVFR